jgi:hypothetical protein
MRVVITIDTEADNQWEHSEKVELQNLDCLPRFQALSERYGFPPSYLCAYEVVASDKFEDLLRDAQRREQAEIGAHLHPWTNPPFAAPDPMGVYDTSAYPAYPSELSIEVFRSKLSALSDLIARKTGRRPTSYRAGRWGLTAAHIPVLLELGYTIDCSVTPLVSWQHLKGIRDGGPDFRAAPVEPYYLDPNDVCRKGDSHLFEAPVTILFTNLLIQRSAACRRLLLRNRKSIIARGLNKVFGIGPRWFRPYPHMSEQGLLAVYRAAKRAGLPVIEMMFHSSELMAGGSPYNPDGPSIERLYQRLEGVFHTLADDGCKGATLSQLAPAAV